MLALIVPSLLLTTLAFQALDAEARARESDRALGLRRRAEGIVRELDGVVREPARLLRQQVEERARSAAPAELVGALSDRTAHDSLLTGIVLFDAQGRRAVPVARATAPVEVPSACGGLLGACLARSPERLAEGVRARPPARDEALELLRDAAQRATRPAVQAGVYLDLGRAYAGAPDPGPSDQLNAVEAVAQLSEFPVDAHDAWGRPAAAWGRLEQAQLLGRMGNRSSAERGLDELLQRLEPRATTLAAEEVAELAQHAAAVAEAEGLPQLAERARGLATRRRELEKTAARLEELFGRSVRDALTGGEALPLLLKQRVGGGHAFAITAATPGGAVIFGVDASLLEGTVTQHLAQVERAALLGPADGVAADAQELTLRQPLEHLRVQVRPEPALAPEEGLSPQDVRLSLIVLSMVTIAIGVGVTIRAVRREAKVAQLKTDWVANVTHELKTPLTSIRMFLETLLLGRVDDEQEAQECLQVMSREAERLTRLIEQMLVFSRIESRKGRLRLVSTEVRRIVDDALKILSDQFGIDATFEVVTVQELPPIVVDRFAMTEAVLNLLHNAWKYSANTGRERALRVVLAARRKGVEISVEDNGIGVPPRDRKRIFVKFERGTNAERERVEGSGIGLTMANTIVRAHGGWIRYTQLKQGSRFTIHLPK
ncbi:MAG: HAMP domain-containing sensor histidine kinase [Planctomycetota bacterium]